MKLIIRNIIIIGLFFGTVIYIRSQSYIDSINNILPGLNDNEKISAYIDLAFEYYALGELDLAQENANKALILSDKYTDKKQKANAFNILSSIAQLKGALNTSITNAEKALALGKEINNSTIIANACQSLGYTYFYKSDFQKALKNWEESLKFYQQLKDEKSSAQLLFLIGVIYKNWSEYNDAIDYYEKALAIYKKLNDDVGMARIFGNLGNIYFYSGIDFDNALDNYQKALEVFRIKGFKPDEAQILHCIGLVYQEKSLYNDALNNFRNILNIAEEINDNYWKAQALSSIGNIFLINKNFNAALQNFNEALDIFKKMERKKDVAIILQSIGSLYHSWNNNYQAKEYYLKSIELCEDLDLKKELSDNFKELSNVLANLSDYKNAYKYHQQYAQLSDSIFSAEYKDMITEWNARLKTAEKEAELSEQKIKLQEQEAEINRKNIIVYCAVAGILIVLIFSSLLYKQFREKKKANILLQKQNEEIKNQRDKIFQQNKEITDSIEYASKIQSAILPPNDFISKILPEHFILYRPRDIVSGDFYWLNQFNNQIFLCAADCTGHGVPGAFMSMLGITLLNEIINKKRDYSASDILNNLRAQLVNSMHQRGNEGETQDGMDIAFCILDLESKKIQFSGAFNPLFIIRDGELLEFKGDKMPIGVHIKQDVPFTNHETEIMKGDKLYVFSDGYVDQFGGPKRKKFLMKRFRDLLLTNSHKNMSDQKTILENEIDEWMGPHDQIDDILVFGARIF